MSHRRNATPPRRFLSPLRRIFTRELLRQFYTQRRRSLVLESLEDRSLLATVTWDGGAGTLNYADAANWNTNTIPTVNDDVIIPDLVGSPTIIITGNRTVNSFVSDEVVQWGTSAGLRVNNDSIFRNGARPGAVLTVGAGATLILQGNSEWIAGQINGPGVVRNEGILQSLGNTSRTLNGTLINANTFIRNSTSAISITDGAASEGLLTNLPGATIEITTDGTRSVFTGSGLLDNFGTIRLIGSGNGEANMLMSRFADHGGTIEVVEPYAHLTFLSSSSSFDGTHFEIPESTAIIEVAPNGSGVATWSDEISGTGSGRLMMHQINSFAGASFVLPRGMLWSTQTTTFQGDTFHIPANSDYRVEIPGGSTFSLRTTMQVDGEVIHSGVAPITTNSTGSVLVASQGRIHIFDGTAATNKTTFTGAGFLENRGEIFVEASEIVSISTEFHNIGGSVLVSGTDFRITTGGNFINGHFLAENGGVIAFSGAPVWSGTFTGGGVTKSNTLQIDPNGAIFDFDGGFTMLSGFIQGGNLTIPVGSAFYSSSTGGKVVKNNIDVYGTFTQTGANFSVNFPGVLHVRPGGLLSFQSIGTGGELGSTAGYLVNEGTIRTNTSSNVISTYLDTTGVVEVQPGHGLSFSGRPIDQHQGSTLSGGTWIVGGILNFATSGINAPVATLGPNATVIFDGPAASFFRMEANQFLDNQGTLIVKNGKTFSPNRNFVNNGTIIIDAASFTMPTVSGVSVNYTQAGGTTNLLNDANLIANTGAVMINGGTVRGVGALQGNVNNNSGALIPGTSPGILTINGNYTQGAAASLDIEVAGTNPTTPDFDQLVITGDATLDGTLNVTVLNDFLPSKGEVFRFLTAAQIVGDFQTKNLAVYQEYPLFAGEKGTNYYDLTSRNIIVRNNNDSGPDSLRQAILTANAAADLDNILLHIPGPGPHTIAPLSDLPIITQPVNIDGYAQNGAARNTLANGSNATIKVELNGDAVISGTGLLLHSDNVLVTGLSITGWADEGIVIEAPADSMTRIAGNFIGLKPDGVTAAPNSSGILLDAGARNVTIGGTTPASRNVISGNSNAGVLLEFGGTTGNVIEGNYIGTNAQGTVPVGNSTGVMINVGATSNTIGGTTTASRNLISGNQSRNVWITGAGSEFNSVIGNFIGTDVTGNSTLGTPINFGILIDDFAYSNFIGGATNIAGTGPGNVISGHLANIHLETDSTLVQGNLIGTNATGTAALGGDYGIVIANNNTNGNTLGGNSPNLRNVISGNNLAGVRLENPTTTNNKISGNYIGLNRDGNAAIPNGIGIQLAALASNNTIGGIDASYGNTIAGNSTSGIEIIGAGTSNNIVIGNTIGLMPSGDVLPNFDGIQINNATANFIGNSSFTSRNLVSGNTRAGIRITGASASGNVLQANAIGTDPTATSSRPNEVGVLIDAEAHDNVIGQTTTSRNIISGNSIAGIRLEGGTTVDNVIAGNTIGLGINNEIVGNAVGIIDDGSGATNTIGGLAATTRNTISGNQGAGIWTFGSNSGVTIQGNIIGLDPNGTVDRGNQGSGIFVQSDSISISNNTISGNGLDGLTLAGTSALVGLNRIGLDHSGSFAIGNDGHGIQILNSALTTSIDNNTIAGNSAGVRNEGTLSTITSNLIGTNNSGLKMLGNRRGSGVSTSGHFGVYSSGSNAAIGGLSVGNIIAGHDIGLWLEDAVSNSVIANLIGTDALEVASMSNTIGVQFSGTTSGSTLAQNSIANSLTIGLRLLDGTNSNNQFVSNRYFGNLGVSIDAADLGPTLNDLGDSDGTLNFPVLEFSDIVGDTLLVRGYVGAGRAVELYVSTPTINGLGQGATSLGTFIEGSAADLDAGVGNYGPEVRGVSVGTAAGNRFEFAIPLNTLPPELRYGSLITAVALGSTSEFGNAIPIGDPASALAPQVFLPLGVSLVQGESLRVQGSFRDDDSTQWTLTVDYGDGTGPQPLAFNSDHTFILEHTYPEVSTVPYQVTVVAIDNANRVGVGVMGVTVGNEPPQPTFNSFEFSPIVLEGQAVTLEGAFTDSGSNDSHTVSIDWGDGSAPTLIPLPVGSRTFTSLHVYPDDGLSNSSSEFYRIRITLSDNLGGFSTTPDGLYIVEVKNELPTTPAISLPASLIENQLFGLSGSFDDLGLLDTHTVTVNWGDGSPLENVSTSQLIANPTTRVFSLLHRFPDNPTLGETGYNFTIEVVDDDQPLFPVRVSKFVEVVNETPSATLISPSVMSLNEGEIFSLDVTLDDSGPRDSHQVVIDWGDGSENKVIDLAAGVLQIPTASHRYVNDPTSGSLYTVQVQIRDKDMPDGTYITDTRQVVVNNVAPTVTELHLFTRSGTGPWTEQFTTPTINEGDEIKLVGKYVDPGKSDMVTGVVEWSPGVTTSASVSNSNQTFEARFLYTDDFPIGTLLDEETVLVTLQDGDGGSGTATKQIRVANASPSVSFIPEVVVNPQFIPLSAKVSDRGTESVALQWQATDGSTVVQTGSGNTFTIDRSLFGTGPIVVSVTATDDDGGSHTSTAALLIGTTAAETLTIDGATFTAAGVDTLLVLGLGGADVLDASAVPAPFRVILDGGDDQDFLYGGGGDDVFILRSGDDSANVDAINYPTPVTTLAIPNITPNYAGNDLYFLKPNSTLTVVDLEGSNQLDYSLASFGIEFSLAIATGTVLVPQAVATGDHYVAAVGTFDQMVGSSFADSLTGASNARTYGGLGADTLKAISGTTNASFFGGQDADLFETAGIGLSEISFEGDDGPDIFTNLGSLSGGIIFSGGADADLFTNLGTIFDEISFEGDDGADIFSNDLGGVLAGISFEGDTGSDRFINRGVIDATSLTGVVRGDDGADIFENLGTLTGIIFTGGADADLFTNELTGLLGAISFEGDDGADIFTNSGHLLAEVIFTGGADADLFTNTGSGLIDNVLFEGDDGADLFLNELGGEIFALSFEGDDGADLFINHGELGSDLTSVIFTGGADADQFINETTGILFSLSYEGDDGADIFINSGVLEASLLGSIIFNGGADADLFTNTGSGLIDNVLFEGDDGADIFTNLDNGLITSISFEGDDGADIFANYGELTDHIVFTGGADADLFANYVGGFADSISFEGDDGADIFLNSGDLLGGVIFTGGADDDSFINSLTGSSQGLTFQGDDGADIFTNLGTLAGDVLGGISFEGDDGADTFINEGTLLGILGTVIFSGGADADLFVNTDIGVFNTISFEGDDGADTFTNLGDALTAIVFTGGADADRFTNYDSNLQSIRFVGFIGPTSSPTTQDDGADLFANYGDFITSISFEGDDGADIFQNSGDWITAIDFSGDDGADIFISIGNELSSISFEGDNGADVLAVSGNSIGSILFEGDALDIGSDTFVNRSSPSVTGSAQLRFVGFGGLDALRNDGAGWDITFLGGSDEDTFQNNATTSRGIFFKGDDGADVFENNGDLIANISFEGDLGSDIFANGGAFVSDVNFQGGFGNDTFANSGANSMRFHFKGDDGADIFSNIGTLLTEISFEGDQGNDRVLNYGVALAGFTFVGGPGSDSFFNRELGAFAQSIHFQSGVGDDSADLFVNWASELSDVIVDGGADGDSFQNFGSNVYDITFNGGVGNDQAFNTGSALNQFTFTGSADDDSFENLGEYSSDVIFYGDSGSDSFVQRGAFAVNSTFIGGTESDAFTNYGTNIGWLVFQGSDGDDRFQNNGSDIANIQFFGEAGADAFQNNGDRIQSIFVDGGDDADTLLNHGADIGSVEFFGQAGADGFVQSGNRITSISFVGGDGADVFRSSGTDITSATFTAGIGDDALLWDTVSGTGSAVLMIGEEGNDVMIFRGAAYLASFVGGAGADRLVHSGVVDLANWNGGDGDDRYEFLSSPAGIVTIGETYSGTSDVSVDTLDFSTFAHQVTLDLNILSPQLQPSGLSLILEQANNIEVVIGSTGADTLLGNDRDNYLAGARFHYPTSENSLPSNIVTILRPTQWVWLDFDGYTEATVGEHIYTLTERQAIEQRMRTAFAELNANGMRIEFTTELSAIPSGIDFASIRFNDTPATGRPGGEASEIDFGNYNYGGFGRVQVNGLLGGIEIPVNQAGAFAELLPEDGETTIGQDKPAATSNNFVALSAKMATHELAHLLGVRHYDSFGPVGFGIHSPPGIEDFNPIYSGPAAAFESFDHIIGSPASIGSTRFNDVGQLFFGERESIKLAFATASDRVSLTGGWAEENQGANIESDSPQVLTLKPLVVPNSLIRGLNSSKEFYVDVAAVVGEIQLQGDHSENDYYAFSGKAGDAVTIEVMSMSLDRYTSAGIDNFIDSTLRLYRIGEAGELSLVPYFNTTAINDDEFESTDSVLLDVRLPADGNYVIEVDTFTRAARPTDPQGDDLAALSAEARAVLEDVLNDQDVGKYELFVYRFADASAEDLVDFLDGRLGNDILDGGPGDLGLVQFLDLPTSVSLNEGDTLEQVIAFIESRGESWTMTIDFGDGSPISGPFAASPNTPLPVSHRYLTDGNYNFVVTVSNNYGLTTSQTIATVVSNIGPQITSLVAAPDSITEGQLFQLTGSLLDPGPNDAHTVTIVWGDGSASTIIELPAGIKNFVATHTFADDNASDAYSIQVFVVDEIQSGESASVAIAVTNVSPTAIISAPATINEGGTTIVSLSSAADVSTVDMTSLRYSFALTSNELATDYANASSTSDSTFAFIDNGSYTIYARVIDKDGGWSDYQTVITVNNVAPTATISGPATINEGSSATVSLTSPADASTVDVTSLRYSFALSSSALVTDYANASSANDNTFGFADNGSYTIYARVIDKDGGWSDYQTVITVNNVAPTATISGPATINEGSSTTVSLTSPADASTVDVTSLRYSFALASSALATTHAAASETNTAVFTFTDNGSFTVHARVFDKDGGFSDYQSTITVTNVAPTAAFSASNSVVVGNAATLSFSIPSDPSLADIAAGLRFSFALSLSSLASNYNSASATPTGQLVMPAAGTVTVWGRVFDKDGGSSDYSAQVIVTGNTTNLPPSISVNAPESGVRGIASNFTFTAQDADAADSAGPFVYTIQWGDGSVSSVVGGPTITVSKTYATVSMVGSFTITATATDARDAVSLPVNDTFSVFGWSVLPDPLHPGDTVLVVVGSPHDDVIKVKDEDHHCDYLKVVIRDKEEHIRVRGFVGGNVDAILVFGLAGDDKITIEDDVELPVFVWGGAGDDRIKGGDGSDVLIGEQGDDTIYGGDGRDLLIGGAGSDRLHGDDHEDILVAGYTVFDLNRQALDAIMAEWNSSRDYTKRRQNIMGTTNSSFNNRCNGNYFLKFNATSAAAAASDTVFDDGVQDSLWGNDSRDWFLFNSDGDHNSAKDLIKDRNSNESGDDIDRWF
jgi:hypothetical protein